MTGKKLSQLLKYSHLFNKRGGGAKVATSLNVEVEINVEGGIFGKHEPITLINVEWRVEKIKISIKI